MQLDYLTESTSSPWDWEGFVDADSPAGAETQGQEVAVLVDVMARNRGWSWNEGMANGLALDGGQPMEAAAAVAARTYLRSQNIPGRQSLWWRVPEGTAPNKVTADLANYLDRPRPRGANAGTWLGQVLKERRNALLVVSGVQHLFSGPGARTVHREWNILIRRQPGMLTVMIGDGLFPHLFAGDAQQELKPYVQAITWGNLSGQWGRDYLTPLPQRLDRPAP